METEQFMPQADIGAEIAASKQIPPYGQQNKSDAE